MSGAWLAALLAASEVHLEMEARPCRGELQINGRARGLPEGAVVRLRFRRVVNRVEGEGRVLATGPEEASWVRRVAVRRGLFVHREVFAAPAEVEVEAAFDPAEQGKLEGVRGREPVTVVKVFHSAPPLDTALALRGEARAVREAIEETGRFGGEGGGGGARRRLAALREGEPRALFSATVSLLAGVLDEFLAPAGPRGIGVHGAQARLLKVHAPGLSEALGVVREVFDRERAILVARQVVRLQGEGAAGLVEKTIDILKGAVSGDDEQIIFLQAVEDDLRKPVEEGALLRRAVAIEAGARHPRP